MPGLFSEYDAYCIPYSLLETEQLERCFEEKAEKGYLIKKYTYGRENGKFLPIVPAKYHFSIGIYDKLITDEEACTKQFEEFRMKWEEYGWEYNTSIKNLVIFYSTQNDRPPVPDPVNPACLREAARKVTVKAENSALLHMAVVNILWLLPYLLLFFVGPFRYSKYGVGAEMLTGLFFVFLIYWTWETSGLSILLRQKTALRMIKETGRIPIMNRFWEEDALNTGGYLAVAVLILIYGFIQLSEMMVILTSLAIVSSGVILFFLYMEYRKRKNRYGGLKRMIAILPLILLVLAVILCVDKSDYRFQESNSTAYSGRTEEERRIAGQGMKQEELGWGKADYSFYVEGSNLACEWERIIYQNEAPEHPVDYRKKEYEMNLRYIGTLTAKLKNEKYLGRYLAQKKISPEGSVLLDTDTEMKYSLTRTGKEIIGSDGKDLVIYFLNIYDERSFDRGDGRLIAEIERLDGTMRH